MLTACAILCPPLFYLVHGTYILFLLIFQESFYIFQNNSKFFVKCIRFHDIPVDIEFIFKPCILAFSVSSRISRSEEHTSELQSRFDLVCRLLLEKKKQKT